MHVRVATCAFVEETGWAGGVKRVSRQRQQLEGRLFQPQNPLHRQLQLPRRHGIAPMRPAAMIGRPEEGDAREQPRMLPLHVGHERIHDLPNCRLA